MVRSTSTLWSPASALPVALLLSVIAFHGYQVIALEDDPQRGGAFAMFATVDIGATRKVLATAGDGAVIIEIPASLDARHAALLDRPSEHAARDLAAILRDSTWSVENGRAIESGRGGVPFETVRLEVVGFVADGRTIGRQVLVDVTVGSES